MRRVRRLLDDDGRPALARRRVRPAECLLFDGGTELAVGEHGRVIACLAKTLPYRQGVEGGAARDEVELEAHGAARQLGNDTGTSCHPRTQARPDWFPDAVALGQVQDGAERDRASGLAGEILEEGELVLVDREALGRDLDHPPSA